MDAFEKELKISFLQEAIQLLSDAEECFLNLEKRMYDEELIDRIFRLAHNLKGSASAVGFAELGDFTHELESLLLKIKNHQIKTDTTTVSLLLACSDHLRIWVNGLYANFSFVIDSSRLTDSLQKHGLVTSSELDEEEILSLLTLSESLNANDLEGKPQLEDESIRVALPRLEKLMNYVGELVILQTVLNQHKFEIQSPLLQKTVTQLNKITKDIQEISMSLRMLPLKQTFQKMQRIVRDSAHELEKEIQFIVEGEDTEIDKTVIEKIGDPLVHLIRNAVDHGIEPPDEREKLGKSRKGRIYLRAFHAAGKMILQIRDDGRGLDPQFLRAKAIEKGLLSPDVVLTDKEAQNLIFMPGFSTKAAATDLSGRGVGMDVVKTNIEKILRGEISIQSQPGLGTLLIIQLPLTLAIIEGLIVSCSKQKYIIPLFQINESLQLHSDLIHKTTGLGHLLTLRGEEMSLFRLNDLLSLKTPNPKPLHECIAIIVRAGGSAFAVAVDDIVGQHQVVIKTLGVEMKDVKGFAGGAILGDGKAAMIIDLPEMISNISLRTKNLPQMRGAA